VALQKRLAGTAASVGPFIGGQSQGLGGQSSPRDLPTLFQLAYLTLTAPRADTNAYAAVRGRLETYLANRGSDPRAAVSRTRCSSRWRSTTRARARSRRPRCAR
jgi:zinc protease